MLKASPEILAADALKMKVEKEIWGANIFGMRSADEAIEVFIDTFIME